MNLTFLAALLVTQSPSVPELNKKLVSYCQAHLHQQVGKGECSDLAQNAMKSIGIWQRFEDSPAPGDYVWGKFVYRAEVSDQGSKEIPNSVARMKVVPGDIVQFRNVVCHWHDANVSGTATYPHHTAVIAAVQEEGTIWDLYEQNANGNRFVIHSQIDLRTIKSGSLNVYQPIEKSS